MMHLESHSLDPGPRTPGRGASALNRSGETATLPWVTAIQSPSPRPALCWSLMFLPLHSESPRTWGLRPASHRHRGFPGLTRGVCWGPSRWAAQGNEPLVAQRGQTGVGIRARPFLGLGPHTCHFQGDK